MARPHKPAADRADVRVTVRFTADEAHAVTAKAHAGELSLSELLRRAVLTMPQARRRRAAPAPGKPELAQLLGAVGRIGSNVNQLARVANQGGWPEAQAIEASIADIAWMRAELMRALGVAQAGAAVTPEDGAGAPRSMEANDR